MGRLDIVHRYQVWQIVAHLNEPDRLLARSRTTNVARTIGQVVGYTGDIDFDPSKPDGTPRKLMDSSRLNHMGWQAKIGLQDGPKLAYQDFLTNQT